MAEVSHSKWTEEQITRGLLAVIAWAGNCAAASRDLEENHQFVVPAATLRNWTKNLHHDQFERLREEHAPAMEAQLAAELRDSAAQAVVVQRKGMELATHENFPSLYQ